MIDININVPALERIAAALEAIVSVLKPQQFTITGGEFMFILPDDHADIPFTITPVVLKDVEGKTITNFTEEFVSDNPDAIAIVFTDPADIHAGGVAKVGAPGLANVNYTVRVPVPGQPDQIVVSKGSQFTITTGTFATAEGGDVAFEGITEA